MSESSLPLPGTRTVDEINDDLITSLLGCHLIHFFDQWDPSGATVEQITSMTKLDPQDVVPWLEAMLIAGGVRRPSVGRWALDELGYATMWCAYRDRYIR
ncbi:hypothetical protein [Leifsonia aquatica]|uniref:hypothetical protein n=1 Tax=Leifsonia aquatica TaxID=144185 RepID=UPI00381E2265